MSVITPWWASLIRRAGRAAGKSGLCRQKLAQDFSFKIHLFPQNVLQNLVRPTSKSIIQFLRLPPPRAIPPGFVFFLQECSKFPTPGTLKLDNSPPRGIATLYVLLKKKKNYLPSKIGFNFCKLFFPTIRQQIHKFSRKSLLN